MQNATYALFLDVMGVQQRLFQADSGAEASRQAAECGAIFERFHRDFQDTVAREIDSFAKAGEFAMPLFVAEFSDSAYVISNDVRTLTATAVSMMRRSVASEYPLRGGIGFGTFAHETSGSIARGDGQIWSASSFFGSAVVTAYQAERTSTLGLRVFIHPTVIGRSLRNETLNGAASALPPDETTEAASHEVRVWAAGQARHAKWTLLRFRDKQQLTDRAKAHYEATSSAYERFLTDTADLPFDPDTLWVFRTSPYPSG